MKIKRFTRTFIAGFMALVCTAITPMTHIQAAGLAKQYVKEFRLFVAGDGKKADDAKKWFKENGYTMIEGNINEDASGALKKEVGVYLGYSTTTDPKEAVRDIALMNETGGYSVSDFDKMLEQQKESYKVLVEDMKDMIAGYKKNYEAGQTTAKQAHDFLNTYKEDDSGKMMGDLLLEVSDEDLASILLQANSTVVLSVQQQLAYANEGENSTWMDRMQQLGSYDKLYKKYLTAAKNNEKKALSNLKKSYYSEAVSLSESWENVYDNITEYEKYRKKHGLNSMNDEEQAEYLKENEEDFDTIAYMQRVQVLSVLHLYKYDGDKDLYDYFNRPKEDVSGENIRDLYTLVASLTDGQRAALSQSASLIELIQNAGSATVFNDYDRGVGAEVQKAEEEDKEVKSDIEDAKKQVE